jgi:hypothetical protein
VCALACISVCVFEKLRRVSSCFCGAGSSEFFFVSKLFICTLISMLQFTHICLISILQIFINIGMI